MQKQKPESKATILINRKLKAKLKFRAFKNDMTVAEISDYAIEYFLKNCKSLANEKRDLER